MEAYELLKFFSSWRRILKRDKIVEIYYLLTIPYARGNEGMINFNLNAKTSAKLCVW